MKTFIHTVNVVSNNKPERTECLTDTMFRNEKYRNIYNFNKPNKLYEYSEFCEKGREAFENLQSPYINRVDIAWDSEDKKYFEENKKYFRYLLTAFELAYKSKNSFNVKDLLSDDDKSYWVKSSNFDVTFYNKGLQIVGKDREERTQARFELRLKRLGIKNLENLKERIVNQADIKFTRALQYLEDVQYEYNRCLIETYRTGYFETPRELVRAYQDRIFSKRQLINLLSSLDKTEKDIKKMAENLKYRCKIQFISETDMKNFAKDLFKDMQDFLESNSQK